MKHTNSPISYSLESWISSPIKKFHNLPSALLLFAEYLQNELRAKGFKSQTAGV